MTCLDLYREFCSRWGDGSRLEVEPMIKKSDVLLFSDLRGSVVRKFRFYGNCLNVCIGSETLVEIRSLNGEVYIYDETSESGRHSAIWLGVDSRYWYNGQIIHR